MQSKQLLVVVDNDSLRKTLERYLVGLGVTVTTTRTVADARDLLSKRNFDALLLDINLPDDCGLNLVDPPSESSIPVIAMTAENSGLYRQRACDAGVAAFLGKPFPLARLNHILNRVFDGHR